MPPPPFRVIIAGSRGFTAFTELCAYCDKILARKAQEGQIVVLSGHCRGVDLMGRHTLKRKAIPWRFIRQTGSVMDWQPDRNGTKKWQRQLTP